jgi:8-oxo-dGTP pyrophosphatase MutT (NUDIX family)
MAASGPERWIRGEERSLARTRVLDLREVEYFHAGRRTARDFVVIAAPDWVNVVAVTPQGHLVLVRQFRHGINHFSLEVPGGVIEAGENPVAAGLRELREETGYAAPGGRLLASVHPNPAIQNNRCHLVLVEGAEPGQATDWDPDEEIEILTAPVPEVLGWARDGLITHSLVLCALFHYQAALRGAV